MDEAGVAVAGKDAPEAAGTEGGEGSSVDEAEAETMEDEGVDAPVAEAEAENIVDEGEDAPVAEGEDAPVAEGEDAPVAWKAEPRILTEEDLEAMLEDTDGPPSRIQWQADGPTDFGHLFNHGAGAAARGHGDVLPMAEADEQPLSTLSLCCPDPQFEPVLSLQADAEELQSPCKLTDCEDDEGV